MDWKTAREGKKLQGETAAKRVTNWASFCFFRSSLARKKMGIRVKVPRIAEGKRAVQGLRPKYFIKGRVRYMLRVVG